MVKGNPKSSASSATRKKHAAKKTGTPDEPSLPPNANQKRPKTKAERKLSKKEPRMKMYIPPVKPAPVQPDPLETTGLARTLPADLLVVLRNISKKAQVTKIRALEELQTGWVEKCIKDKEDLLAFKLVEMLPVWLHHVSALFLHPSRRVRFLAVSLHASFLRISAVRDQILFFLQETASPSQTETILGAWSLAAHDVDRAVATTALKAWKETILSLSEVKEGSSSSGEQLVLDDSFLSSIGAFVQRTALDPAGIYEYLNPSPPVATVGDLPWKKGKGHPSGKLSAVATPRKDDGGTLTPRSKIDEQEESEQDRNARLRISALGAMRWIFGTTSILSTELLAFSSNPALWTALHPNESCPWIDDFESFGFAQPNVRKAAWGLVQALLNTQKGQLESIVPILGFAILRSAWVELDPTVQENMWQPLLVFLKQFPQSWTLDKKEEEGDGGSESEVENDDDEPQHAAKTVAPSSLPQKQASQAYLEFLQFLQLGCSGSPLQGYPTVMIILSTIPSSVMISSTDADAISSPLSEFFTSFWAAVDGRALSSLHRSATSAAFLSSLLECMVFLIKRMRSSHFRHPEPDQTSITATTSDLGGPSFSISEITGRLVKDQYSHIWNELGTRRLKVEERAAARLLGKTMEDLGSIDSALMDSAWEAFVDGVRLGGGGSVEVGGQHELGSEQQEQDESEILISTMLKVFYDRFKDGTVLKKRVIKLVKDVLDAQVEKFCGVERLEGNKFGLLVRMLGQFREGLFFDEGFSSRLDDLLAQHAFLILDLSPSLLLSYLLYRKNEERCLVVWHSLLSSIASTLTVTASQEERIPKQEPIVRLLDAAQRGQLPSYLKPNGAELDEIVANLLEKALTAVDSDEAGLVKQILTTSDYFISKSGYNTILQVIVATFGSHIKQVIYGKEVQPALFEVAIGLVDTVFEKLSLSSSKAKEGETLLLLKSLLPDIFLFGYLLPLCDRTMDLEDSESSSGISHSYGAAKSLWERWIKSAKEDMKEEIVGTIKMRLKMFIEDTHIHPLPEDVLLMLSRSPPGIHVDLLHDIFPSSTQLDLMLDDLSPDAIDPSIAILDSLIPPFTLQPHSKIEKGKKETDRRGFGTYARIVNALLQVFIEDRQLAKRALWVLRHFLALSVYALDLRNVPSPTFSSSALSSSSKYDLNSHSPVFDHDVVTIGVLRDVVSRVKQVSVYLLGSAVGQDDGGSWRKVVLEKLLKDAPTSGKIESPKQRMKQVQQFLWDIIVYAKEQDKLRDTRVLKIVLESVFSDVVDVGEADLWIQLARKLEKTAPQTSMTIIAAITSTGAEAPKLDRYRNEIAASLLGIKPQKANTEGLLALRRLDASAPDPDGDVVFLSSPRAINVVKACQGWVLADDGDDEEGIEERVESAMLPIFMHLAPILQNVPGGPWAFVFDVLESVLERASSTEKELEEEETEESGEDLIALTRALRLVLVLEELATRNKSLMAEWEGRRMGVLVVIRDLSVLGLDSADVPSVPLSTCRELVLSIVKHLPSSLIDQDTLSKTCHLIQDPSPTVQKKAYQLLQAAAKKRTEYFVIEAAVDTEGVVKAELPIELMMILQREMQFGFNIDEEIGGGEEAGEGLETRMEEEDQNRHLFGYLLAWMLVFDLFQDASIKVKSNYIEQLKNHDMVVGHLIPCFLSLLRLDQGSLSKVFKLDVWSVDEFYIDLYEPGSPHTIPVLAAHLYYRALLSIPSLIHSWVLDCKDRQLTNAVTTYTSTHFSPVIIRAELEHVRTHSVSTESNTPSIVDESMSVKVAQAVNEVVATYSVDEHQLEIKFKIPFDWPLHRVEVKDVKMVGVEEKRWRAWVLGVQQTLYAHNGRIVDGISLFKKTVTLHFEGQVDCAICYSIISVMDGSLPKKPCKTCKNRFHAGCLYKWFHSSHSSKCPLCRSDIM